MSANGINEGKYLKYLMFGNNLNGKSNDDFMFKCVYDINTNSMKFINLQKYVNKNGAIATVSSVALRINDRNQIIIKQQNTGPNDIVIYDFINHCCAKYHIDKLEDEWGLTAMVYKKNKHNEIIDDHFIIFGG
eukprot:192574_1